MSQTPVPPTEAYSSPPAPAKPPPPRPPPRPRPARRRPWWRRLLFTIWVLIFIGSLVANAYLALLFSLFLERPFETTVLKPGRPDQIVAVWDVTGLIDQGQADVFDAFYRKIRDDPNVKAVVLRVNSGGGYIAPCDQIYSALIQLRDRGKKLVVSMGGGAASGGYYISVPADEIYAEPGTVTGSIGVMSVLPVIKGTLEKYGAKAVVLRSTKTKAWKAAPNWFEEPADHHVAAFQKTLDVWQARFESVVQAERKGKLPQPLVAVKKTYTGGDGKEFTVEETEPFNGKVYLTDEAIRLGLVDTVGYLADAISRAESLAALSQPKVVRYARRKSMWERFGFPSTPMGLDVKGLEQLQTPRLMMVWRVQP